MLQGTLNHLVQNIGLFEQHLLSEPTALLCICLNQQTFGDQVHSGAHISINYSCYFGASLLALTVRWSWVVGTHWQLSLSQTQSGEPEKRELTTSKNAIEMSTPR